MNYKTYTHLDNKLKYNFDDKKIRITDFIIQEQFQFLFTAKSENAFCYTHPPQKALYYRLLQNSL